MSTLCAEVPRRKMVQRWASCVCGPSFSLRSGSVAGLPIVKVPAGIGMSFKPSPGTVRGSAA
jgi:hypothetical protein